MDLKHPLRPEEITPEWINIVLKESGTVKEVAVKNIKKEIIGGGKGFLSSSDYQGAFFFSGRN